MKHYFLFVILGVLFAIDKLYNPIGEDTFANRGYLQLCLGICVLMLANRNKWRVAAVLVISASIVVQCAAWAYLESAKYDYLVWIWSGYAGIITGVNVMEVAFLMLGASKSGVYNGFRRIKAVLGRGHPVIGSSLRIHNDPYWKEPWKT